MRAGPPKDEEQRTRLVATLVRRLHRTEQQLHELTGGQVDAVLHPLGQSYLLRNAQEQLRLGKSRLQAILRSMSDAVIAVDVNGRIEMLNPQAEQLTGWSEVEARDVAPGDIIRWFDGQTLQATGGAHRHPGAVHRSDDTVLITRVGKEVPVSVSTTTITDERGVFAGMVMVMHDQTVERRSRRELMEARAFAENIVATIQQPLLVLDAQMCVISANRSFYSHFRVEPAETLGLPLYELGSGQWDTAVLGERLNNALFNDGHFDDLEMKAEFAFIGQRTLLLNARRIRSGGEHGAQLLLAIEDVTERRRLEEQVHRAQRLAAMGELAGGVAHDFNNILAAIRGNVELALGERSLSAAVRRNVLDINKAAARGKNLVQQILAFTRQQPQQRRIIALGPLVEEAVTLLRATLPTGVTLEVLIPEGLPPVLADATQIHQVLVNLCTNAWHALEGQPGQIRIRLRAIDLDANTGSALELSPGNYLQLSVQDTGKGMDAATMERIFEPFFTTKGPDRGTGLGLAVAHGVIYSHDGSITVSSEPGRGTRFDVYLPATTGEVDVAPPRPIAQHGSGQRILYLDDDGDLVSTAEQILDRLGYRVVGFTDVAAAMNALRNDPEGYDLVITDLNMPGRSGLQVARELLDLRPTLPVVLSSGHITDELIAQARSLGVRDVLYKPNTVQEYAEAIHRLVSSGVHASIQQSEAKTG